MRGLLEEGGRYRTGESGVALGEGIGGDDGDVLFMGWRLRLSRVDGPSACRCVVLENVRLVGVIGVDRHCRHALKTDIGDRRDINVLLILDVVVSGVFDALRLSFAIARCRSRPEQNLRKSSSF